VERRFLPCHPEARVLGIITDTQRSGKYCGRNTDGHAEIASATAGLIMRCRLSMDGTAGGGVE
jgi:hypothetical protein